ncbi:MAG: FHA domain-containing protein [Armatimonadetes bacterium]|nr:FHA domain-containing protein [Armatimonadota bacterium]
MTWRFIAAACILWLVAGPAPAQQSGLTLKAAEEGEYIYWLLYTDAQGYKRSTEPEEFNGKAKTLDPAPLKGRLQGASVLVLDSRSGNVAQKDLPPGGSGTLTLQRSDFTLVRKVRVHIVTPDGKDIRAAKVDMSDPKGWSATRVLDPASQGVAEFLYVPTGQSSITIGYSVSEKRHSVRVPLDVPLERADKDFSVTLKVDGSKGTLGAAPAGEEAASAPPSGDAPLPLPAGPPGSAAPGSAAPAPPLQPGAPAGSPLVALIGTVVGLAVLLAAITIALRRMKEKGETVDSVLSRVGVDLPKEPVSEARPEAAAPAPVAVEDGLCPYCGQAKDLATGACACAVTERAAPAGNGVPRLVGIQGTLFGQTYPLEAESIQIGRDETNAIPMADPTVSRKHAQISAYDGSFLIRDLGSSNGTFVNGSRITEHILSQGDIVQVGSTKFRFETG